MKILRLHLIVFMTGLVSACQPLNHTAGSSQVSEGDGALLVFVPAGDFLMGSPDSDTLADGDEKPQHSVYLSGYWIDRTEVTNSMYQQCVAGGGCNDPAHSRRYGRIEYADHPILGVSWDQAVDYCAWAGRRLPTEAEWEKAARGTDGRLYPWGDEPPDEDRLNFDHMVDDTTKVGSYPAGASPYGALDMSGNAWEWAADGYDETFYVDSPDTNPFSQNPVNQRVLRGGSWTTQTHNIRTANRFWAFPGRNDTDGFRCAMDMGK